MRSVASQSLSLAAVFDRRRRITGKELWLHSLATSIQCDEMKRKSTGSKGTATKPKTHDDYLARVSADKRAALQKLRRAIKAAAPKAEECISYQLPAFRLNGKFLVAYGAAANHCAFYPGSVLTGLGTELKNYDTSKGTLRFPAEKPLPATLVRKLVKLRMAEKM
jgi:uncharacterized protein YdhG (YjbR/CyaY superfamily)